MPISPRAVATVSALLFAAAVPGPSLAILPGGDGLPVGPPPRLLSFDASVQGRLSAESVAWQRLQRVEGDGWFVRWDEKTGLARTLLPPGVRWPAGAVVEEARGLLERNVALIGVASDDLVLTGDSTSRSVRYLVFSQHHRGVPVDGAGVELRLRDMGDGMLKLFFVRNRAVRVGGLDALPALTSQDALQVALSDLVPRRTDVVQPGELVVFAGPSSRPALAWRSRIVVPDTPLDLTTWVDAHTGAMLYRTDDVRRVLEGTISVDHEERTIDDPIVTSAVPWIDVIGPSGNGSTDASGFYSLPGDSGEVGTLMSGSTLFLSDGQPVGPSLPSVAFTVSPGGGNDFTWTGGEASWAARDVLAHFAVVREWVDQRWPTLSWLGDQVPIEVNAPEQCNAFYFGGSISFQSEDPGYCVNFGRISDIVYHEYGHGVHDHIIQTGVFDGAISEGSADFLSALIWDDPELGIGAFGPGTFIREIESDRVYPDDLNGEVHNDGLIWASAMWDLREELMGLWGDEVGEAVVTQLFLGALQGGPTLTDAFEDLVVADDSDGDLTNGTPHLCLISEVMDEHGIGPGELGFFLYDHDPLDDQPTETLSYPIEATFEVAASDCSAFDTGSIKAWYATDPEGPYEELPLAWDGGTTYSGEIPRFPTGASVWYWIEASDTDGDDLFTSHGGDPEQLYRFYVGELEVIFCDDLESGDGSWLAAGGFPDDPDPLNHDWELGTPQGMGGDPDGAWSGDFAWGTDVTDDGRYTNLTTQFLTLAPVSVGDQEQVWLRYRRWLTVEDGLYDHAEIWTDDQQQLWGNGMTEGGSTHHVDVSWVLHELDLTDHIGDDGAVAVSWFLESDPGLELGGWNIDDVCLVGPQDLAPLYEVGDFDASDDEVGQSTLTWTQPAVLPLWSVAVVRNSEDWPTDIDDGVLVYLEPDPQWGEAITVVDDQLEDGRTYRYAVFTAPTEWAWTTAVVEGANADSATTWEEQPDDDDSAEPVDDDDTTEEPDDDDATDAVADDDDTTLEGDSCEGCSGCGGSVVGPGWKLRGLAGFGLLVAWRRRRT